MLFILELIAAVALIGYIVYNVVVGIGKHIWK